MESASPLRQSIQVAAEPKFLEPEELSASCGVGGIRWAMMVDQLESKGRYARLWHASVCVLKTVEVPHVDSS